MLAIMEVRISDVAHIRHSYHASILSHIATCRRHRHGHIGIWTKGPNNARAIEHGIFMELWVSLYHFILISEYNRKEPINFR